MPTPKAPPQPATSPWVQRFEDYLGRAIDITVTFNQGTRELTDIVVHRDAGCLFTKILLGIGDDGTPDSTTRAVHVPVGTTDLTPQQLTALKNRGLTTIEQVEGFQITAGR